MDPNNIVAKLIKKSDVGSDVLLIQLRQCAFTFPNLISRVFLRHTLIMKPNEYPGTL